MILAKVEWKIQNRECKLGRKQVLHLLETLDRFTLAREKMLYFYHDSREATISGHMPIPKLRPRLAYSCVGYFRLNFTICRIEHQSQLT